MHHIDLALSAGSGNNVLNRFRLAWIGLLATCTALQMWSANVTLNLTDTYITKAESNTEVFRARVTFFGFAALAGLNAILILILGMSSVQLLLSC